MEQKINCTQWDEGKIAELLTILKSNQNVKIIVSVENESRASLNHEERIVGYYLNKLGVPNHLRGYSYIKYGILRCLSCPEELESVTKILYPNIAKKYQTSSGKVEHGIRHAIAKAWDRKENEEWKTIFGFSEQCTMTKPTNSRFLATITDYIKLNN